MTTSTAPLDGKVAVVTGGGRGIGRAEALALGAHGARVVVNARSEECEAVAEEIRGLGGEAVGHRGSVASPDDARGLIEAAVAKFGRLDVLVNNAGVSLTKMLDETTPEDIDNTYAINVGGHFNTMRHAIPVMKSLGGGRIINTASGAWNSSRANAVYGSSKAAVVGLTYGAAWELRDHGITCNALCPFGMTSMVAAGIAARERVAQSDSGINDMTNALRSYPPPDHAAPLVVFLASDAAAGVTGFIFRSGGGRIAVYSYPDESDTIRMDISSGKTWTFEELVERVPAEVLAGHRPWWVEGE